MRDEIPRRHQDGSCFGCFRWPCVGGNCFEARRVSIAEQERIRAKIEEADRWYAEELERLRERAPA